MDALPAFGVPQTGCRRRVRIGAAVASARTPSDPWRVPLCSEAVRSLLRAPAATEVLGWMLQKNELGQDMFLLGPPGPYLRRLVMAYCALLGKELEYVPITRDTNETDLKQRREVVNGRLVYVDQAPVRAARYGRVLLLEGLEKAERNVLPALNNLLENREITLEDGSFLAAPHRSAALRASARGHLCGSLVAGAEEGSRSSSLRGAAIDDHNVAFVSKDFQVIAIGSPCRGNPLDPPLRSRFAAKEVGQVGLLLSEEAAVASLRQGSEAPPLTQGGAAAATSALAAMLEQLARRLAKSSISEAALPALPLTSLACLLRLVSAFPRLSALQALLRVYPSCLIATLAPDDRSKVLGELVRAGFLAAATEEKVAEASDGPCYAITALEANEHDGDGGAAARPATRLCRITWTAPPAAASWMTRAACPASPTTSSTSSTLVQCGAFGLPPSMCEGQWQSAGDTAEETEEEIESELEKLRLEENSFDRLTVRQLRDRLLQSSSNGSVPQDGQQFLAVDKAERRVLLAKIKEQLAARRRSAERRLERKRCVLARGFGAIGLGGGSFCLVGSQRRLLSMVLQDHACGADVCLLGERGVGKSQLVRAFSLLLGYQARSIFCHQDMTTRDLLQRRTTDQRGNTIWEIGPLLQAAIQGDLAVLDGVHRLANGVLYSALGQLLQDREVTLADGTRLLRPEQYQALQADGHLHTERMGRERILQVHPAFRVIATGEPPGEHGRGRSWLTSETLTLFHFHDVQLPSCEEQLELSARMIGGQVGRTEELLRPVFAGLAMFSMKMQKARDAEPLLASMALSLRQTLRIGRHLAARLGDVHGAIDRALSARLRFLPLQAQEAVDKMLSGAMAEAGILPAVGSLLKAPDEAVPGERKAEADVCRQRRAHLKSLEHFAISTRFGGDKGEIEQERQDFELGVERLGEQLLRKAQERAAASLSLQGHSTRLPAAPSEGKESCSGSSSISIQQQGGDRPQLCILDLSCPLREAPKRPELVPQVHFVDVPHHVAVLRDMLLDWALGQHLLLIGNQGVGKNKLADRLLGLLRCEREYVQLHRDTTVQSLTMSQALQGGTVVSEDSAVVRALTQGRCLVVDEADKAPLEVVCVLKALADDSELALGDGRTIVRHGDARLIKSSSASGNGSSDRFLEIAEGFRLIVLANRPGFPFHGNDFYRVCGDVFSSHVVDNPRLESELALLRDAAPDVPAEHLARLALLFRELRELADSGQISYPYSTRELIKVVRHLQRFPRETAEQALSDVFAFDLREPTKKRQLLDVLAKHGFNNKKVHPSVAGAAAVVAGVEAGVGAETTEGELPVATEHGDMTLRLEDSVSREDGFSPANPDGQNPPELSEDGPKHGHWDGQQHIGGNFAAGGSGGTGTAGLGGRWGPYRLDVGQTLVMVPEHLKSGLSKETEQKMLRMAQEAHAKELEKIRTSGPNWEKYETLRRAVRAQVIEMRAALEAHEARERERVWLKQQTQGELDDARLIDGITGGRNIYMRRGEPLDSSSARSGEQRLPKRLLFMLDISGSMYTFNRLDNRMRRLQELVVFLFEAFDGLEQRYDVSIKGHSGNGPIAERLVDWGRPVVAPQARLDILERMELHAQFASPGDATLPAAELAVMEVASQPADEHFVFLVSDADLSRYGISGAMLSKRLTLEKRVHGYVILISNNTGEAEEITAAVAPGRAHICAERTSLATTFKTILTHACRAAEEADG